MTVSTVFCMSCRLFIVPESLIFSVISSRSSALRYEWPSWMSVKSPDACSLGKYETEMAAHTDKRSILTILRKIKGL